MQGGFMTAYPWFRSYNNRHQNGKMLLAAKRSGLPLMVIIGFSEYLLSFANQNNPRGSLKGLPTLEIISIFTQMEAEDIEKALESLEYVNFINKNKVIAWEAAQPARIDETASARKQRERQKKADNHKDAEIRAAPGENVTHVSRNVTQCHADVTQPSKKRGRVRGFANAKPEKEKEKQQQRDLEKNCARGAQQQAEVKRQRAEPDGKEKPPEPEWQEEREGECAPPASDPAEGKITRQGGAGPGDSGRGADPVSRMVAIWREELPENPYPVSKRGVRGKLAERWEELFDASEEKFRQFCREVAARPLLVGKIPKPNGSLFHAPIDWMTRPEQMRLMAEGNYGQPDASARSGAASRGVEGGGGLPAPEALVSAPEGRLPAWRGMHEMLVDRLGVHAWRSWLSSMRLVEPEAGELVLQVPTRFVLHWVQQHCAEELSAALMEAFGEDVRVTMEVAPARASRGVEGASAAGAADSGEPAPGKKHPAPNNSRVVQLRRRQVA
jgi:hypothetical protein